MGVNGITSVYARVHFKYLCTSRVCFLDVLQSFVKLTGLNISQFCNLCLCNCYHCEKSSFNIVIFSDYG
ncbi:hypothetical protein D3C78_875320 [compost metagenome]